jgi:hypothetical protein
MGVLRQDKAANAQPVRMMRKSVRRGSLLRRALLQALRKMHAGRQKLKLDADTRWQVTSEAVEELHRYGGWKALNEEAPMRTSLAGETTSTRPQTLMWLWLVSSLV